MVHQALSDAAREFCQRTRTYTIEHPLTLSQNSYEYAIALPDLDWYEIKWAKIDGKPLDPGRLDGPVNWADRTDRPLQYASIDGESIRFWPRPDQQYTVQIKLAVSPQLGKTALPAGLYNRYGQEIARGAAADLLEMEGYPWYNPNMAPRHRTAFASAIQQAVADRDRNLTSASPSVRMRPIA
ncbi:MAG: hypothetical protein CME59_22640 [Halioglobus sp.]|nr:hypothetical protein [Halioglobus sp.]|tara:strand:+ start:251 stop:799 length:549 start_codon:yes stop_codon:yes gene_type:complete